jgi:hypothetical protein
MCRDLIGGPYYTSGQREIWTLLISSLGEERKLCHSLSLAGVGLRREWIVPTSALVRRRSSLTLALCAFPLPIEEREDVVNSNGYSRSRWYGLHQIKKSSSGDKVS